MSLFRRVFLVNAALLVGAGLALAFAPATVSTSTTLELGAIGLGLLVLLAVNYVLLRQIFAPLDRLARGMHDADLLVPGQRLAAGGSDEIGELVRAFNTMVERLETERRESGRRVLAGQEAERKRIAAELHDAIGQSLTGVLLLLERTAAEVPAARSDAFLQAQQAVREALDEVRRIAKELRPELLEHLGLSSALKSLAKDVTDWAGLELEWSFAPNLPPLDPDAEVALFRIAQESLTNVARHAHASRVWISLEHDDAIVSLRVADDGRGLDGHSSGGDGLRGMRERAVAIGAVLTVGPASEGGVEVRLEMPVQVPAAAGAPR